MCAMEYLCPSVDRLIECHTCGLQSLPPYQLCVDGHVGCQTCIVYRRRCRCGYRFTGTPQIVFDGLVSALKLRCKYRKPSGESGPTVDHRSRTGRGDDEYDAACENRWFDVDELRKHYRTDCPNNRYACPLPGCGHVARVDTVVEHYETTHGPVTEHKPDPGNPDGIVTFRIPSV